MCSPIWICHGANAVPNGPPGVTATGSTVHPIIACTNRSGGVPAPLRSQVWGQRHHDEMAGRAGRLRDLPVNR